MTTSQSIQTARLTVDVDAVVSNYRTLGRTTPGAEVAGVVKADCYGLGAERLAPALWRAGCRRFFVARPDEGVALRAVVPEAKIYVFDGVRRDSAEAMIESGLVPVLNTTNQLDAWSKARSSADHDLSAALHVDTGMLRLGLSMTEAKTLATQLHRLEGINVEMVISHLASADEASSSQPEEQLNRFETVRQWLPMGQACLANSSGVFRDESFHFDVVRPGYALYGGNPAPWQSNPMTPVVTVEAPILQVHRAEPGQTVGYGASFTVERPMTLATVAVGYADGFHRAGSNRGSVLIGDHLAPIVGKVSMDLITVDVSNVPERLVAEGSPVELIGRHRSIDEVAEAANTIGYEILTSLGSRYERRYLEGRRAVDEF